jgi:hypothetical protein
MTGIGPGGIGIGPPIPGTPPPIGVIGVIHFDFGVFQGWEEIVVEGVVNDPAVIRAVTAVNEATSTAARIDAISQLLERLE